MKLKYAPMKLQASLFLATGATMLFLQAPLPGATTLSPPLETVLASVQVENPLDEERTDTVLHLSADLLGPGVKDQIRNLVVYDRDIPLPTQPLDLDGDGALDSLTVLVDLKPDASVLLKVVVDEHLARADPWPKRTQAEISRKVGGAWEEGIYSGGDFVNVASVSFEGQLPDHNTFMRYEGPGWESDKVGFRLYLDHRNGIDVFGKKVPAMVLQDVGVDGYASYHEPATWGMDILKVGSALGMGGFGAWSQEQAHRVSVTDRTQARVLDNGPVVSQIRLDYEGWEAPDGKTDLTTLLSINAGSHLTAVNLSLDGSIPEMVTGIPKHPGIVWLKGETDIPNEAWTYLAGYGPQSLSGDNLGLVIFVRRTGFEGFAEDDANHLVRLKVRNGEASYRFGAVWESSTGKAASLEAFTDWIESTLRRLNRAPRVAVRNTAMMERLAEMPPAENSLYWTRALAESVRLRRGSTLAHREPVPAGERGARWNYTTGLLTLAMDQAGELLDTGIYQTFARNTIASFVGEDGTIATYDVSEFNIDKINSGKMLLRLYEDTGEDRFRLAAERLLGQMEAHPRTTGGAFWHKQIYPYQLWLDGVYMAAPFLVKAAVMFGESHWIADVLNEFQVAREHMRDPATGLYYHAWDEKHAQDWADPQTGLSSHFWGRGLGWFAMALVDTLDQMPPEAEGREALLDQFRELAEAVIQFQNADGVWYQVLDQPERAGNFEEASVSAMFTYALARGVNQGYLDPAFADAARRGYAGLVANFFALEGDGTVSLTGICEVAGLGFGRDGSWDYYMGTPIVTNDEKGLGPALLAGLEMARLAESR